MKFKFFQKDITSIGNTYLGFDMDDTLINVLRYKQLHNLEIVNDNDIDVQHVGVPISNCFMRILTWRNYTDVNPEMIEIDYRIFESNTTPTNFTLRMETLEFLRRVEVNRYERI